MTTIHAKAFPYDFATSHLISLELVLRYSLIFIIYYALKYKNLSLSLSLYFTSQVLEFNNTIYDECRFAGREKMGKFSKRYKCMSMCACVCIERDVAPPSVYYTM